MLLVENQALASYYSTGTIQMVPGRDGYEPAFRGNDPGEAGFTRTSDGARYLRPRQLQEASPATYSANRRLASSAASNVGTFIDLYA